jgi:hypothetical protein
MHDLSSLLAWAEIWLIISSEHVVHFFLKHVNALASTTLKHS